MMDEINILILLFFSMWIIAVAIIILNDVFKRRSRSK